MKTERIFLVTCGWDYEGREVKAVVRTREEAELLAVKYQNKEHFSYHNVVIEEWTIGEITDRRLETNP